jgi:hypothetical protein
MIRSGEALRDLLGVVAAPFSVAGFQRARLGNIPLAPTAAESLACRHLIEFEPHPSFRLNSNILGSFGPHARLATLKSSPHHREPQSWGALGWITLNT